ncbi:MAG TPA: hypothetical protein VLV86_11190 [Vicinamibacterales bacterium]|nr:hypothetical protein [Vicinamibacterales bacterium]
MADEFGIEQTTDEDRAYEGSRYADVRAAIRANPYRPVWGRPGNPPLPMFPVTLLSVVRGILSGDHYYFLQAAERTVDSHADLRWGPDRKGFRRLLHPNGVCLFGQWRITEDTPYSGYFARGRTALLVARYSTCCRETRRGHTRSLALVGKLFPTTDPDHPTPLRTANFITQEDIGGAYSAAINDAVLLNAPDTTALRRGSGLPVILVTGMVLSRADRQPTIRQLYPIAELGKPDTEPTRAPGFMRLMIAKTQPTIPGEAIDFRDEVMAQIFDPGDPQPKRTLRFDIDVTDEGETHGTKLRERRTFGQWRRIGHLVFSDGVVSANGDRVVHFNHPTWRDDRNDPSTATRVNEHKVRQ